jgi:endonuclease YncB( thermonuclease family)
MPRGRAGLLAIVLMLVPALQATAQRGSQHLRLSDGDSFSLGGERYRLQGIDAPELHQECKDAAGRAWPCGVRARTELRRIIADDPVRCRTISTDRYGRNIAVCQAGGRDLAEAMVRSGFATVIDRRGAANPYRGAQEQARVAKRGLWAGTFDKPGDWRRANPRDGTAASSSAAPYDWLARKVTELWQALVAWLQSVIGR